MVVGILAHVDAGKTTLSEGLLYHTGKIKKPGRVDHGSSFLDTHALEKQRGITIFSKQAHLVSPELTLTLLDTPGHVDFSAEMERTLQVLDYAILVLSGTDGVQAHTETLWNLLTKYRIPTFIFVTKMDLAGSDQSFRMDEMKRLLSPNCVNFSDSASADELAESIAVCDDALLERYLNSGSVSIGDTAKLICERKLFPCYFGSGLRLTGIEEFWNGLTTYMKEPAYPDAFSARVYKVNRDPQGNRMTFIKVTGGTLSVRTPINYQMADGTELEEKVTQIRIYSGDKFETVESVTAGSCCAVLGLSETFAGQGLGAHSSVTTPILEPVMTYRILPPKDYDPRLLLPKLRQLCEEEPQLNIVWDPSLKELHAHLMGEMQIEILKSLISQRFDIDVEVDCGRIQYKETISQCVEGVGHFEPLRHYAEVHLLLEPLPRGSGIEIYSDCRDDVLDNTWQRLIFAHLSEKRHRGKLLGMPITDIRITLVAGRAHLKHTEGGDFRQATYRAVRHGIMQAEGVILEPYYSFKLDVPSEQIGRAINDIQSMSGTFSAPEAVGDMMRLVGSAPVSEMRNYYSELLAYTRGRGRLSCTVEGYAPCHNSAQVMSEYAYDPESDTENTADSVFCAHGAGFIVKWDQVHEYMHVDSGLRPDGNGGMVKTAVQNEPQLFTRNFHIEQKELDAIMEKEFGAPKQFEPQKRSVTTESKTVSVPIPKKETIIVDGYNIIFAWDSLKEIAEDDLGAARQRLMDILANYQAFVGCELILVFDGYLVKGNAGERSFENGIHVVYTKENETGDMYIEKFVDKIGKNELVRVATSDRMIQLSAFRSGVLRMSAKELESRVRSCNQKINELLDKKWSGKK